MMRKEEKKTKTSDAIRFVGGGALSKVTCQILSDILGRKIETVDNPQNVGAVGAAVVVACGLGLIKDINEAKKLIPATDVFYPNKANHEKYNKYFNVYKELYNSNKKNFAALNG